MVGSACASAASADPDYLEGRTIYQTCAACHGKSGEGAVGPTLDTILDTFPSCDDHVAWVRLGSDRWLAEVGDTYADGKPVKGGMPEFDASLSDLEIRQIAFYERVRFGESPEATERAACGL